MLQVLTELATLYFALPPPRSQAANPLGNMLSSMFGGPMQAQSAPRRVLQPATGAQGAITSGGLD